MVSKRTDLAIEEKEGLKPDTSLSGVKSNEEEDGGVKITRVNILDETGSKTLNKPIGKYVTIEFNDVHSSGEGFAKLIEKTATELSSFLKLGEQDTILIAGLGNSKITPDALGPLAIDNIIVTRHLKEYANDFYNEMKFHSVAAISPGVLGQTGVETAEIIKGVVNKINPAAVIVVDALCSRKMARLAKTIQISDSGIVPGGGVDNERAKISKETLGVPVISMGVPTVVDAATLATDVLEKVIEQASNKDGQNIKELFKNFSEDEQYQVIRDSLTPFDQNVVVTPKEIDVIITEVSKIVGFCINKAVNSNVSIEDMESLLA